MWYSSGVPISRVHQMRGFSTVSSTVNVRSSPAARETGRAKLPPSYVPRICPSTAREERFLTKQLTKMTAEDRSSGFTTGLTKTSRICTSGVTMTSTGPVMPMLSSRARGFQST